jgi:hypothetical protein
MRGHMQCKKSVSFLDITKRRDPITRWRKRACEETGILRHITAKSSEFQEEIRFIAAFLHALSFPKI